MIADSNLSAGDQKTYLFLFKDVSCFFCLITLISQDLIYVF